MLENNTSLLNFTTSTLINELKSRYAKGTFHARELIKYVYEHGSLEGLEQSSGFIENQSLAQKIWRDFDVTLPAISNILEQDSIIKFTTRLDDGCEIESVIIPMKNYNTLCLSSQVGCARNCSFCATAKMGLIRNLQAKEIVAQYMLARFMLNKPIQNIVYMGMGEPFDNLNEVLKSVDILSDIHGAGILKRRISLSTCGQVQGLLKFNSILKEQPEKGYYQLTLSVSLHSALDSVRSSLMPVNTIWSLMDLKVALIAYTELAPKETIYFEYIIIPGLTDTDEQALAIKDYCKDLPAKINLIPYQSQEQGAYPCATREDVDVFWKKLRANGIPAYSRHSKGNAIQASCGQLATGKLSLMRK